MASFYTVVSGTLEHPDNFTLNVSRNICVDSSDNIFIGYSWFIESPYYRSVRISKSSDSGITWSGAGEILPIDNDCGILGLAVDSNDNIFVLYYDSHVPYSSFIKKRNPDGSWGSAVSLGDFVYASAIAIDSNDYIYVLGSIMYDRYIYKSTDGGVSFSGTFIFTSSLLYPGGAMCIDNNDDIHIIDHGQYIKCSSGVWGDVEIIMGGEDSIYSGIIVDSLNVPHVSMGNSGGIWYANKKSGSWDLKKLFESGFPAITIDRNNTIYVIHYFPEDRIRLHISFNRGDSFAESIILYQDDSTIGGKVAMFATYPKILGVSKNIRPSGYYLDLYYYIPVLGPDEHYLKFGTGLPTSGGYAFVA